ncbi:K Homology domain-containing protein [Caenorhabditis elegans]|uniref:K Homology domain-containing protein n=1 Tax=Caenorhabditis elegans TaxID=6239 RepID=Q2V4X2_CAEEL|nr:K Homology domain-containing protein [Caenorhabditis elegans]CCD61611.1 K Homology domain-containing protein [Caenorhabditis elegans]|eukprot:NP_001040836.2 Uncharacterized protein CELE_B0280.17 [Caenorhabditis elegans]
MSIPESSTNCSTGSYLDDLLKELQIMTNIYESNDSVKFRNAHNLLVREIKRVYDAEMIVNGLGSGTPPPSFLGRANAGKDESMDLSSLRNLLKDDPLLMTPPPGLQRRQTFSPMTLSLIGGLKNGCSENENKEEGKFEKIDKVFFPPETANNTNPVGRLIGPRGMTIRQLEKDLGCKLFIRGKGCTKDDAKEERLRERVGWEHLKEPIHVMISVRSDSEEAASEKLSSIKKMLQEFLEHTDSELKRSQLMQLAVIEGTLK